MSALRGYEYAPLGRIYRRAQALADELGDQAASMRTGMALWSFAASGNFETALDIAKRLTARAHRSTSPQYSANSQLARGVSLLHMGQMARAATTLAQAHGYFSQDPSRSLLPSVVVDPEVSILCNWARALWFQGRPDQGLRAAVRAWNIARELRHPKTSAYAAAVLADIYHLRRDTGNTLIYAGEALKIARPFELGHEITWASSFRAWALTELGDTKEGCELEMLLGAYGGPCRPKFWSHCAWSHGVAGNPEKGLKILAEAFRSAQERRETYYDAEMRRLEGELLLMRSAEPSSRAAALACFQAAINVSRTQKALSLELRAASSILRFATRYDMNSIKRAAATLLLVLGRLHEGLETPDIVRSDALLVEAGYRRRSAKAANPRR